MIPVSDRRVLQTAAHIATHNPWFLEWVQEWRVSELNKLAYSANTNDLHLRQGRVQALDEILRLITNAEVDLQRSRA